MAGWQKENCVLYATTVVLVLGLFWLSGSWHSLWAMLMLGLTSTVRE